MSDLKPCPCCNKQVKIRICDDEGNIRPDSYRNDPWSGLKFWIEHVYEEGYNCPLAHHSDELHGLIYESKEEAIEVWNTRPIEDALRAEVERVKIAIVKLSKLARRNHYANYEDPWYSCPKSPEGCCDDKQGDRCNCGADSKNDKIDAVLRSISMEKCYEQP